MWLVVATGTSDWQWRPQWHKQEGDTIAEFDALCEVRSDKAVVTISSPFDGIITKRYYGTAAMTARKSVVATID